MGDFSIVTLPASGRTGTVSRCLASSPAVAFSHRIPQLPAPRGPGLTREERAGHLVSPSPELSSPTDFQNPSTPPDSSFGLASDLPWLLLGVSCLLPGLPDPRPRLNSCPPQRLALPAQTPTPFGHTRPPSKVHPPPGSHHLGRKPDGARTAAAHAAAFAGCLRVTIATKSPRPGPAPPCAPPAAVTAGLRAPGPLSPIPARPPSGTTALRR